MSYVSYEKKNFYKFLTEKQFKKFEKFPMAINSSKISTIV